MSQMPEALIQFQELVAQIPATKRDGFWSRKKRLEREAKRVIGKLAEKRIYSTKELTVVLGSAFRVYFVTHKEFSGRLVQSLLVMIKQKHQHKQKVLVWGERPRIHVTRNEENEINYCFRCSFLFLGDINDPK